MPMNPLSNSKVHTIKGLFYWETQYMRAIAQRVLTLQMLRSSGARLKWRTVSVVFRLHLVPSLNLESAFLPPGSLWGQRRRFDSAAYVSHVVLDGDVLSTPGPQTKLRQFVPPG